MNFSFLRIPVYIHPSFWLLLLIFSDISKLLSITSLFYWIIIFISLLVHEYGHGITALYFGAHPKIELNVLGGITSYSNRLTEKKNFLITLNGPLLESLLIFFPYLFLKFQIFDNHYLNYFLYLTMRINIFWCILNLVPLYPLDGGKLFRYLLQKRFGENGLKLSIITGILCAVLGSSYFLITQNFMIGSLFLVFGLQNFSMLSQFKLNSSKENDFSLYNESLKAIGNNEVEKAKILLTKLTKSKANSYLRIMAIESLAEIFYKEKEEEKAYDLLLKTDHSQLKTGKCLLCKLAYMKKNYALVEKYSQDIYAIDPTEETALLNSRAYAFLDNPDLAGGWLKTASLFENMNKEALKTILEDKIYNPVREKEDFKQYLEEIVDYIQKTKEY